MSNSRLWRDSNTVPVSDIIEFNEASTPDGTGNIQQTNIVFVSAIGVNEKPKGQLDELQDTGLSSVTYTVTGFIDSPTSSLVPDITKKWMVQEKTTASYPFGRFGLQLDDFPHMNVRPNINRGLILTDWTWVRDGDTRGKASFIAVLRLNSDTTGLNSSTFEWDTT